MCNVEQVCRQYNYTETRLEYIVPSSLFSEALPLSCNLASLVWGVDCTENPTSVLTSHLPNISKHWLVWNGNHSNIGVISKHGSEGVGILVKFSFWLVDIQTLEVEAWILRASEDGELVGPKY